MHPVTQRTSAKNVYQIFGPGVYTLPQKKRNFSEVAFLLGRSVGQWNWGQIPQQV